MCLFYLCPTIFCLTTFWLMVNHIHDSPVEDFERSHKEIINV